MSSIQITTTIDEATHAEAKRRGIGWSRAIEAGMNQLIKGQSVEDDFQCLKEANSHLRYNNLNLTTILKESLEQNELLKAKLKDLGIDWADYIIRERQNAH